MILSIEYLLFYLIFLLGSTVFSFLINGLFIKFAKTLGMRNLDQAQIRWASTSKPALGGISFFILFLFSITLYLMFAPPRQDNFFASMQFLGMMMACSLGFLTGLADDAYNTKPILKFTAQVSCGIILTFSGTYINLFDSMMLNYLLTITWVVGIMNSINMLDNMDAITSVVSIAIILCAIIVLTALNLINTVQFFVVLGVLGAIIGFLFFNWNPSKIYMGDTGSQFLGVMLSSLGITCFWNAPFDAIEPLPIKKILLTMVIFLIPIVDTTTVVINRIRAGKSPFVGGRDHTTHHLSYAGFTDRQIAIIMGSVSLLGCVVTIFFMSVKKWEFHHTLFFGGYVLLFFIIFYATTILYKAPPKKDEN